MKTLIAYYSHGGDNETLAKAIEERLTCDILRIEEARKRSWIARMIDIVFNRMPDIKYEALPLAGYEYFVLMAPIWAGKIAPPFKSFV